MRAGRLALAATAIAALVACTAGCAHHDGASSNAPSGASPSVQPSQLAQMQRKVDAAESAAAAADRDATSTADR
ncbi:hypothetical protein [Streptomyces alanosinicus]|uniref:Lipoprotein n=1 Tax=Streptomyces alanosinicus TaxID=68171 RepID=A0A918YLJ9_9ACTN|nr:hypothetical protein [Streptomyces alanosinicus]GHE08394.1 hypothetical protein GCM10010339_56620 [Streptomyces alanosinicus]